MHCKRDESPIDLKTQWQLHISFFSRINPSDYAKQRFQKKAHKYQVSFFSMTTCSILVSAAYVSIALTVLHRHIDPGTLSPVSIYRQTSLLEEIIIILTLTQRPIRIGVPVNTQSHQIY